LILNLQTVVEELGTKLRGKAWVIITSQADIDAVTKEKVKGHDFSRIQARFDTRLSLSSANVDEVIKKRVLLKKEEHKEMLSSFYTEKKTVLKNLISFSRGSAEMKNFKGEEDFVGVYPFIPYQFNLLQKVFDKIRETVLPGCIWQRVSARCSVHLKKLLKNTEHVTWTCWFHFIRSMRLWRAFWTR